MSKSNTNEEEITEAEFEALLDELEKDKKAPVVANTSAADSDLITEEEFDNLLDELASAKKNNKPQSDGTWYKLEEDLGVSAANRVYEDLPDLSAAKDTIVIDAEKTVNIHTLVLQVLVAYVREARKLNINVSWKNPEQSFLDKVNLLGLSGHLGIVT